jgi:hypothetical protein
MVKFFKHSKNRTALKLPHGSIINIAKKEGFFGDTVLISTVLIAIGLKPITIDAINISIYTLQFTTPSKN